MKKILILEDLTDTRRWLCELARNAVGPCSISEAGDIRTALQLVREEAFDLALIDLGLPDGSGLDVIRAVTGKDADTIAIVMTVIGEDASVVAALAAGAQGYLLKDTDEALLARQLSQYADGVPLLSPAIARRIVTHFRETGPAAAEDGTLTDREKDVLALIGRGLRNADVASALGVAESTVASHIKSVYRKLGISSRAEASWHATRLGLRPDGGDKG